MPTPYGDLYLTLPVAPLNLGLVPADGILVSSYQVPGWWQPGSRYPFQALVGPMTPGSKLTNLMLLEVE
jgi:hypothetical protein